MGKEKPEIDKTTLWVSLRESIDGCDDVAVEPTIQPDATIEIITSRIIRRVIEWHTG